MADLKAVENDHEPLSHDEAYKEAGDGARGDLGLGGKAEKALVRKLNLRLIPLIMLLYTFSFLDRYVKFCHFI
jgi:hypothetical protein